MGNKKLDNMKYKILYIGLHPGTLKLLIQEGKFSIDAVSFLDYFDVPTINPVNWLFKVVYKLRNNDRYRFLELFFLYLYLFLHKLSSGIFYRYSEYICLISKLKIKVIDAEDDTVLLDYIQKNDIDLAIVNSWGILSEEVVSAPKFGTINLHPSALPKYRGALPTLWALKNGDDKSALTVMTLNRGVDTGGIIRQHEFLISKTDNAIDLENKIDSILEKFLVVDIVGYLNGEIVPYVQNESLASVTGFYGKYKKIDWESENAIDIYNKIMAYPYIEPGVFCYFYSGKDKVELRGAKLIKNNNLEVDGDYYIECFRFFKKAKNGIISARLFFDIGFNNSLHLILKKIKQKYDLSRIDTA